MRNKTIALIVSLALSIFTLASASALTMAGYDGEDSSHDWTDNEFFQRMENSTGLSFTFDQYTNLSQWQAAKDTMFASGDLPDVLFKAALSVDEQITYSETGQLIDLLPLLPEYAPNLWALLEENPEWLAAITLPNGKVAALPTINSLPMQNAMWINQDWLDALELEAPTDWDSLISVLTAFKEQDPNQNGKQDEIPLSFLGPWDLKFLAHAFGIVTNDYNIYVDEAGQVRFISDNEDFITFIQALVSLNDQGLLDEDGFATADALRTVSDDDADVTYGIFFGPTPYQLFTVDLGEQFTVLFPLEYNGSQVYRDLFGPIATGSFAITSACQNPEELLAWVDILYTEDGAIEAMAGIEGETYVWSDDGTWQYAVDLELYSSYVLYDLSIYDTGKLPWLSPTVFYASYDTEGMRQTTLSLIELQSYTISPFPYYYVLTSEQYDTINPLQASLGAFVDESIARFVTGEWDIDAHDDLDAFYDGLADRGLQEFLSFWQDIYDGQRIR